MYTHAGPEIGVAATKTFLTQLVAVDLVALYLGQVRGVQYGDEISDIVAELAQLPAHVARVLTTMEPVRAIARALADVQTVLFLGRHVGYPVALEGALKLKELAYMHAEGFAAGELKHGPIALIEAGLPVVVVMPSPVGRSVLHNKLLSNIQEVQARGARTIVIAEEGDDAVVPYADELITRAGGADAAAAAGIGDSAASLRVRVGDGARQQRRPPTKPGQVRHRRVGAS